MHANSKAGARVFGRLCQFRRRIVLSKYRNCGFPLRVDVSCRSKSRSTTAKH